MASTTRARRNPGPPLFVVLAACLTTGVVLRAHDPGLSALDVTVAAERVTALLSVSAADTELAVVGIGGDATAVWRRIAIDGIRVAADGLPLMATLDRAVIEDGATYVELTFPLAGAAKTVTIASDIPARLARGHRQMLTVREGGRVVVQRLLDARTGSVPLPHQATSAHAAAVSFFRLGVSHILAGYDHLLFLAGLLLASRRLRELLVALTAFTAAHSLTLALAALGVVHIPASIVEPLIAVSIAWIGIENLLPNRRAGARWLVVFLFGLVHGFGFAEALLDLGRWSSRTDVAVTLLSFTAGVEIAQAALAVAAVPLVRVMRARPAWNERLTAVCSVVIVIAGGFWLMERL
jgi:hydrogenase/urease accessory protein HupE